MFYRQMAALTLSKVIHMMEKKSNATITQEILELQTKVGLLRLIINSTGNKNHKGAPRLY